MWEGCPACVRVYWCLGNDRNALLRYSSPWNKSLKPEHPRQPVEARVCVVLHFVQISHGAAFYRMAVCLSAQWSVNLCPSLLRAALAERTGWVA